MYHSDPNTFQGRTYETYRTPQQEAARSQANGQLLDAIVHILWWIWAVGPLALSAKAGFNWHELTGDTGAAAERGAQALARWKWFQFGLISTTVIMLCAWSFLDNDSVPSDLMMLAWWTNVALFLLCWLVMYVRLAEFSLFQRGPIQWVMTPLARALDPVHTWAIAVAALLPVALVFVSF